MRVYSLEIERDIRLVPTARMFSATVARHALCSEESVLDLKIAVSEACASALDANPGGPRPPILIRVEDQGTHLAFEIEDRGLGLASDETSPGAVFRRAADRANGDEELRKAFIRALFPDVRFHSASHGTLLSFDVIR